jgi:hypothetical protein
MSNAEIPAKRPRYYYIRKARAPGFQHCGFVQAAASVVVRVETVTAPPITGKDQRESKSEAFHRRLSVSSQSCSAGRRRRACF